MSKEKQAIHFPLFIVFILMIAASLFWLQKDIDTSLPVQESEQKTADHSSHDNHKSHLPDLSGLAQESEEIAEMEASVDDLLPQAENVSEVDPKTVPRNQIVFERYTLDELRSKENLPAIDVALRTREKFPEETDSESANTEAHELYMLERSIHRNKFMALHKVNERNRYWKKYQNAKDPEMRSLFLSSAKHHAKLALKAQNSYQVALRTRMERMEE